MSTYGLPYFVDIFVFNRVFFELYVVLVCWLGDGDDDLNAFFLLFFGRGLIFLHFLLFLG